MKYKSIYWFILCPFIKKYLKKNFSKKDIKLITKNAKKEYIKLISKADDIGEKNPMSSNLYFALLFLSFHTGNSYLVTEKMLKEMIYFVLTDKFILSILKFDFNNPKDMDRMKKRIKKAYDWSEKNKERHPETWEFNFDNDHEDGIYFYFTKCPIAKYFKENKLEHLTHIFCEIDYLNLEIRKGRLIRNHTIAQGDDICDFWIVGDEMKNPK